MSLVPQRHHTRGQLARRLHSVVGSNLYVTRIFVEATRLVVDVAFDVVGAQSSVIEQ